MEQRLWQDAYTFSADGDQYLAVIPPYRHIWPLVFNEDTTPGPLYGLEHRFLCLAPSNQKETFFILPLDADLSAKKPPVFGTISMQENSGLAKLTQHLPGARPFHPYIIPMKPSGDLDLHLFDGEPNGSLHTGITLYNDKKRPLPRYMREGFMSKQQYYLGNTRKTNQLTWYKAGPGLICTEPICVMCSQDMYAQGYILNIPFLYQ